jgi:hypothetical protein
VGAPKFEITAQDVIKFFHKEYRMKVSESDAREWLEFWGDTFAYELKVFATPHVANIFRQATFRNFPDKAFNRFYKRVDEAIADAFDEYATGLGLEIRENSDTELERCQMIKYLMSRPSHKRDAILWQNFLLQRAGRPEKDLKGLEKLRSEFDFFLDYRLKDPSYDKKWRLYYHGKIGK